MPSLLGKQQGNAPQENKQRSQAVMMLPEPMIKRINPDPQGEEDGCDADDVIAEIDHVPNSTRGGTVT